MTLSIMKKAAAVTAATVLALGLTACGSDSDSEGTRGAEQSSEEQTSAAADDQASGKSAEAGDGNPLSDEDPLSSLGDGNVEMGGSFSGTVDGQPLEIDDAGVVCQEKDGSTTMVAASKSMTLEKPVYPYVTAVVDSSGSTVSLLSIMRAEDDTLSYMPDLPDTSGSGSSGSAEVTKDGSTYVIKGEGRKLGDVTSGETTPFDLSITCP